MAKPINKNLAVAICAQRINRKRGEIQLFPSGVFRASDGRPTDVPYWFITAETVDRINNSDRKNKFIIDYEHQTLYTKVNGQPAPKAGSFKNLVWRSSGVYSDDVEWTARASDYIERTEYSSISPVFEYNTETGEITNLFMAAITNDPAIDGMAEAIAASYQFNPKQNSQQESPMDDELLAALGLDTNATGEQALAALTALKTKAAERKAALATATADLEAAKTTQPDPAKYAPVSVVTELQSTVAALSKQVTAAQIDDLIEPALSDGRILPALESWARDLGNKDIAALTTFLNGIKPVAGLDGSQTGGKGPADDDNSALSDAESTIAAACGITPEQFSDAKKMEAA